VSHIYPYSYPVHANNAGEKILVGNLSVYSNSNIVIQRALNTFIITIINAIIKTLFLWIIFLFVLNKFVVKPLEHVTRSIQTLNPDSQQKNALNQKYQNQIKKNEDELSILLDSFLKMEEALVEKNKAIFQHQHLLENRVKERTEQLTKKNALLMQKTLELEKADKDKSKFLATMSHEIRTPLGGMLGMVELFKNTDLSNQQLRYINTVQQSGDILLEVINNILDYSKLEAGKMELESLIVNLGDIIDDSLSIFSITAAEKNIALLCHIDSDVPAIIKTDSTRLKQILTNLVSNAIKFTEKGAVKILVDKTDQNTDHDDVMLRFQVVDTGPGLTQEQLDNLFKPFRQADSSTARVYGGTGLGLTICKQLVKLLGGKIGVDNQREKGTCFWFSFKAILPTQQERLTATHYGDILTGYRILIAISHQEYRSSLRSLCQSWGMDTNTASNAEQTVKLVIEACNAHRPLDVIVLDSQLPNVTNTDLTDILTTHEDTNTPKVILTTRFLSIHNETHLTQIPIKHRVELPVSRAVLYSTLAKVLSITTDHNGTNIPQPHKATYNHVKSLIVEDNLINQMVLDNMLKRWNVASQKANSGIEALQIIAEADKPFDMIWIDHEMPGLNGTETTQRIRDQELNKTNHPHRSFIVSCSALDPQEYKLQIELMDADMCVPKPINLSSVEQALKNYSSSHPITH
jgi:signal transduction histidine kinase/DNA-binding response OmpR family regulator